METNDSPKPTSSVTSASHRLPRLPSMGNTHTAQRKSSRADQANTRQNTVLHVDGSSTVVKIDTNGKSQLTEIKPKQDSFSEVSKDSTVSNVILHGSVAESKNLEQTATTKKRLSGRLKDKVENANAANLNVTESDTSGKNVTPDYLLPKSHYLQNLKQANRQNKTTVRRSASLKSNKNGQQAAPDLKPEDHCPNSSLVEHKDEQDETRVIVKTEVIDMETDLINNIEVPQAMHPRHVLIRKAEVPSEDQIEKLLAGNTDAHILQYPVHLMEGDMKWAKVSGHPYWPCMVSKCPFSKIFSRVQGGLRAVRSYHVQFFGDECERGWINESSLMDFKGKVHFYEKAQEYKEAQKKASKKGSYNPFVVKPNREIAWQLAVAEAEHAASLELEDRNTQYQFQYTFIDKVKKTPSKSVKEEDRKPVSMKDGGLRIVLKSPAKSGKGQKRTLDETDPNHGSPEQNVVKKQKLNIRSPLIPPKTVPFNVYFASHSSATREIHPEWDDETLQVYLRKQWKKERMVASPTSDQDKKKSLKLESHSELIQISESDMLSKTPLLKTVPFQTYFSTHSAACSKAHPDWDDEAVRLFLRKQWKEERAVLTPSIQEAKSPDSLNKLTPSKTTQPTLKDFWKKKGSEDVSRLLDEKKTASSYVAPSKPDSGAEKTVANGESMGNTDEPMDTSATVLGKRTGTPKPKAVEKQVGSSPAINGTSNVAAKEMTPVGIANLDPESSSEEKVQKEEVLYEFEILKLQSNCKIDKENVCTVCEKPGELVECSNKCGQYFHSACIKVERAADETFTCEECLSGVHSCFCCKQADATTQKCSVTSCNKYYHKTCVEKLRLTRFDAKGFICPMHVCSTCSVDNIKNPKAAKGRLYRCVRCPAAYHVGDFCIPAGSQVLAGFNIVCADHFKPNKGVACHSKINVNWCFTCSKGGTLLCCEACPASYHYECVKVDKTPEEAWFCEECTAGRRPLYGTIVWIKVGQYRWWPGEVCHPMNVPMNIQKMSHKVGQFPVRFFGSHDYYWIHRGRVFMYEEGDKASNDTVKGHIFRVYSKGVQEASEAYKVWKDVQDKMDEQEQEKNGKKPAPFKMIKTSIPIGNVQIHKADLSEIPVCECKPDGEDACASECLNRMMFYECHPASCPAGERCHNQRFQKRQHAQVEPFKCDNRGWGLRSLQDIKKGDFVSEYVGDLIDEEECKKRVAQAHEDNITNFYMLTLDKNRIIDAGPKGNYSRFMNHSCAPNLVTQKWTVNGDMRVGLFALDDIPKGTELTFNYNLECLGNEKKACACGAANCSGFLGVRPKSTSSAAAKEKELKKKKKKKAENRKVYEDECFRCGVEGELVMCDVSSCTKVYHLHCLKLTKPPSGKWRCPWHHCDICGKHAVNKCIECPDSFCLQHSEGNIFEKNGIKVCEDHVDLLENPMLASNTAIAMSVVDGNRSGTTEEKASVKEVDISAQKDKRKYTKRNSSHLVDSSGDACPVLKTTLTASQVSNTNTVATGKKLKTSVTKSLNGSGRVNGDVNEKHNGHQGESEDAESVASLVIDV